MVGTMRGLGMSLCVLLLAACKHDDSSCKPGATVVTLQFDPTTEAADTVVFTVALGTGSATTSTKAHTPGQATQSFDFALGAAYAAGATLAVSVVALASGMQLGAGQETVSLVDGCTIFTMEVEAPTDASTFPLPDFGDMLDLADLTD